MTPGEMMLFLIIGVVLFTLTIINLIEYDELKIAFSLAITVIIFGTFCGVLSYCLSHAS